MNVSAYTFIDDVVGDTVAIVADFGEDVSGSTWLMQWRTTPESDDVVAVVLVDSSEAALGIITGAVTTTGYEPGTYYADLQRTNGGIVSTWPRVAIRLEQDVSR